MLTHFNITQQGTHHIERGDPCQDFSASYRIHLDRLECDLVLAAIADGVGSCLFSQHGAETAVTGFLSCLTHNLNKKSFELSDAAILNLLNHAFQYALYQVSAKAKEMELPFTEFDSTLTGVIFDGSNLWFGHVGDDGIVVLYADGDYEMITERHEGDEMGALYPLCCEEKWQFGKTSKEVVSLVLMTDGVLNYCVDGKAMHNRVFFPFLKPALAIAIETDEQAEEMKQRWEEFLRDSYGNLDGSHKRITTDDITFVLVENPEAVAVLPEIEFDQEKWDEDTKKRRKEVDRELYAEYWKYKEKRQPQLRRSLNDQEDIEKSCGEEPTDDDNQISLPEKVFPMQLQQDKKEIGGQQHRDTRESIHKNIPKSGNKTDVSSISTQGTVIHDLSEVRVSTPVFEAFEEAVEMAYSTGKEIRKSIIQALGNQTKPLEQRMQSSTLNQKTEREKQGGGRSKVGEGKI